MPLWGYQGSSGCSLCLTGDCRLLSVPLLADTCHTSDCPSSRAGTRDRVSFQTWRKQDRGPLSLHFFLQSVSGLYHVLISLELQPQEMRVLSEAKRLASCLCFLSFLSALTQTQQLKTSVSVGQQSRHRTARCLLLRSLPGLQGFIHQRLVWGRICF